MPNTDAEQHDDVERPHNINDDIDQYVNFYDDHKFDQYDDIDQYLYDCALQFLIEHDDFAKYVDLTIYDNDIVSFHIAGVGSGLPDTDL